MSRRSRRAAEQRAGARANSGRRRTTPDAGSRILARLDRLPVWSLPYRALWIIGLGYFFTFFDISDIGFAMPAIAKQLHLSNSQSLFVALAVGLLGYIIGSLLIGNLSDRLGRFRMLLVTIALTAVGSFGDAAATNLLMLVVFRFVTGMGVGADLNLVSIYLSEMSPSARRGRISVLTFALGILGQAVTPFVALAVVPASPAGWRILFGIGGVIAVIGLLMRAQLPESPRWLVTHGRLTDAATIVDQMETTARGRGAQLPVAVPTAATLAQGPLGFSALLRPPYRRRLALLSSMWLLWYIGNYGFLGDAATLYADHGAPIATAILTLALGALGYPVGAIVMAGLADRVERKLLIFAATIVWLIGMVLAGMVAVAAIVVVGAFLASLALGMYLQVAYTYTAESFPTRARASGFALSDGIGHLGGALGALGLPALVAATSLLTGFTAIGLTGLAAGLLALAGPRVRGERLEHVSA